MKTAYNEVAVDLDLPSRIILFEEEIKEAMRKATEDGENTIPPGYQILIPEEFQQEETPQPIYLPT